MAIADQADLIDAIAGGEVLPYNKTGVPSPNQLQWGTYFNQPGLAGGPNNGVLAGTSTAAGVVPTDATAGCQPIKAIQGGSTGYLGSVQFAAGFTAGFPSGVRLRMTDMLFKAGAYSFNSNVSLAAQPSYSSRIPGGDYKGTEIWLETVTSFTGIPVVTIGYTNQDGTAGRSSAFTLPSAANTGRMVQLPLQSGDTGVQKIDSVLCATATVGTFNILVLRPLWTGFLPAGGSEGFHGPDLTDLPIIFGDSALRIDAMATMTNNAGLPFDAVLNIIQG